MAELNDILASGTVGDIKQNSEEVIDASTFLAFLLSARANGIAIPEVSSVDAENGAIFFDPNTGQIRYKSPAGILLRFRMQLV
jgi:hypothetical protein